jgi:hypothetical protein
VSNNLFGVAYVNATASTPAMTVLDSQGNEVGGPFELSTQTGIWDTLGGTSAGFVAFIDLHQSGGVGEVLVPVAADGGIPTAFAGDAGDAGALPGFKFPGTKTAVYGRAINDDVGGVGGVGAAFLFQDSVGFAYVNADGVTHVGPSSLISHNYAGGDYIHVNNAGGSFGVSLYSTTAHSTQVMASGCTP